jgi:hypothetical protein
MVDENDHSVCVNGWMERARGLPPEELLQAFDAAFGALWRRAHVTLGDVTLAAIVDRVLSAASDNYPVLGALTVDATGLHAEDLYQHVADLAPDQLAAGTRFVLLEFLTVLGNLSAEILTPALHSELCRVSLERGDPLSRGQNRERATPW